MRKIILIVLMITLLSPLGALGQESKETLTLKRDLAQERVLRVQAELSLMKTQYRDGQQALQTLTKELESLNASLKALETAEKK